MILCLLLIFGSNAFAICSGSSTVSTSYDSVNRVSTVTITWIDCHVAPFDLSGVTPSILGYVMTGITIPGAPAPTNLYNVTLTDSNGVEVTGNLMAARSATVSEQAKFIRYVNGILTFAVSGNIIPDAQGSIIFYVYTEK